MTKKDFQDYICRPYCMFYKEGQKEEMACRAAQVLEALVHKKRIKTDDMQFVAKESQLWSKYKHTLEQHVCRHCSFRAEDCDFQSATPSVDLEPCGGFIVLAFLKEHNLIDEPTMREMMR